MKELYEIEYDLEKTNEGERLERLIQDIKAVRQGLKSRDGELAAVKAERDKALRELNQIKGEVKTNQGKRFTHPGEIVLFCSAGGPHSPAMVMEVCGFPVGKVGLRVFGHSSTQDRFVYAQYREEGEMRIYQDTWRFID